MFYRAQAYASEGFAQKNIFTGKTPDYFHDMF